MSIHRNRVDRRAFMLRAAAAGAASLAVPPLQATQSPAGVPPVRETSKPEPPLTEGRSGSDFMVDVLKSLGIEYVCSNTGSSFRGLQESVINYGGNKNPEFVTCCHEESSVAMAHGYYKVEGKPLAVFAHGTVGLQHAAMAIYNAYCDRVPVVIVLGNTLDAAVRQGPEWLHSVQDAAAMVRDYTKWDDTPATLQHFAESAVRAYKIAMTPPGGPVVLVADSELQERPIPEGASLRIPRLTLPSTPQADSGAVAEIAQLLVAATTPAILAGNGVARTPSAMGHLKELVELLQAPFVSFSQARFVFPTRHPLNHSARARQVVSEADVILSLDYAGLYNATHAFRDQVERSNRPIVKPDAKVISITLSEFSTKANYQDFQRYAEVDLAIAADPDATLVPLIEAVKRLMTTDRRGACAARGTRLTEISDAQYTLARTDATYGWNASPVTSARLAMEVWQQIKTEDWALASEPRSLATWLTRLWQFDQHHQSIGGSGGAGIGYNAPAAVGAALAHKKHGRLAVNIQTDGDLMYAPGVLWTAAHHRIPLLTVMYNNRAYHEEVMHMQRMANRRQRGIDRAHIGTTLTDPNVDFAKLAQAYGVFSQGPIENPNDLAPALKRAIAVVKRGEPALVDVVTQPR